MSKKGSSKEPAAAPQSSAADLHPDAMEQATRIMKRLAETPYQPHQPLGVRPKSKERPASKGRVHKGKTRL